MKAINNREKLVKFFRGFQWNYLPDAVLDGYMGCALADDEDSPSVAVLEYAKIGLYIVGGDAGHPAARQFLEQLPLPVGLIFASAGWAQLLQEVHAGKLLEMPRYAFTSERLDGEQLRKLAFLIPDGYHIKQMDLGLAQRIAGEKSGFTVDHLLNFTSPEDFIERGFGYCILHRDKIACIATTFAICKKGIEIQINTREKYQGKGLATVAAAQLILHSMQNNLDPNWDAENEISARLAKKLGYTPQGTYTMVVVFKSKMMAAIGKAGLKIKQSFKR
jgi:hypothetical protein